MAKTTKPKLCLVNLMILSLTFVHPALSDDEKDKQECAPSLAGLATCLPYVGGNAKAPTPDCCNGLKGLLKANKKCLCLIVKDRNDPDLSLNINVTLALGLPKVCNAPANVSECPALLHLDPNSPDAQVFFHNGQPSSTISGGPATSPTGGPTSSPGPAGASAQGPSSQSKSDASPIGMLWFGHGILEAFVVAIVVFGLSFQT